jgi:hypothetical protein
MDSETPVERLVLYPTSVADDLGFVALADLATVMGHDVYRVIGGHMVTMLAARWNLGADLYRETGDADLGVPPFAVQTPALIDRLISMGYQKRSGDRFARLLTDLPVAISGAAQAVTEATVDILVPAYTSRPTKEPQIRQPSRDHRSARTGDRSQATCRAPALRLRRLNGEVLDIELAVPDETSALILKAFATQVRSKTTDITDIWRCLEIAFVAGLAPSDFVEGDAYEAAQVIRMLFSDPTGFGMQSLRSDRQLSDSTATRRFTRIAALIQRVLGSP